MNDSLNNATDDPHLQRIRRKLVRLMLGSIVITFVLVGLVLAAVIYKIMQSSHSSPDLAANTQQAVEQQIDLPVDGQITSYHLSGDVLVLQSRTREGRDEFIFYNHRLRQVLSRLKIILPQDLTGGE